MFKKLGFIIILLSVCSMYAQQTTFKKAFLEKWSNSRTYLLALADSMSEENFNFKPTEGSMDFRKQLLHIRENMLWLSTTYFSDVEFDINKLRENQPESKQEILSELASAFDSVYQTVEETDDKEFTKTVDFFCRAQIKTADIEFATRSCNSSQRAAYSVSES